MAWFGVLWCGVVEGVAAWCGGMVWGIPSDTRRSTGSPESLWVLWWYGVLCGWCPGVGWWYCVVIMLLQVMKKETIIQKREVQRVLTERNIMLRLSHPFIAKLHYAFQTKDLIHFIMVYCTMPMHVSAPQCTIDLCMFLHHKSHPHCTVLY